MVIARDFGKKVSLLVAWTDFTVNGSVRIRSPRLHDASRGIVLRTNATNPSPRYFPKGFEQPLYPLDTLIVEAAAPTDVAGDLQNVALGFYYEDLPGISGRFINNAELQKWGVNDMGQDVPLTPGAGGNWTGQVAVNSSVDFWKANTDYALIGGIVDTLCHAVRIQGIDIGNLGVAFPGVVAVPELTQRFFCNLADFYGIRCIPVFNSANKQGILVDAAQDKGGAAVNVVLHFIELLPPQHRK